MKLPPIEIDQPATVAEASPCSTVTPWRSLAVRSHGQTDKGRVRASNEDQFLVAAHDLRCPLHDDPMLGAMVVHLQRQLGARLDRDVLDLHAAAIVDRAVCAPGTVHGRQRVGLIVPLGQEPRDQPLDLLGAIAGRHHDRIVGRDDDEVLDPDRRDQTVLRTQIAVARVLGDDLAGKRIAGGILVAHLPQRIP